MINCIEQQRTSRNRKQEYKDLLVFFLALVLSDVEVPQLVKGYGPCWLQSLWANPPHCASNKYFFVKYLR